ncbi:ATP-grasp domain-containing protein [Deinococcus radiotolerans]|nr:ATP-grasp domain-containing protein [Deinococcus radiotolerans]
MAMRVVFPADYFQVRRPDEAFADQAAAFAARGWNVSALDEQGMFRPALLPGETVLYRGWMLDSAGYRAFVDAVEGAGARVLTSLDAYLAAHHLPRWAPLLADVTPKTMCFTDLSDLPEQLAALGWDGFFVKDFVKSLKTGPGSRITRPGQIGELLERMAQFRGQIEGGVCVRRVEELDPASEERFFVREGQTFRADGSAVPEVVRVVAGRVPSPFFSVDVARRADGACGWWKSGTGKCRTWWAGRPSSSWPSGMVGRADQRGRVPALEGFCMLC